MNAQLDLSAVGGALEANGAPRGLPVALSGETRRSATPSNHDQQEAPETAQVLLLRKPAAPREAAPAGEGLSASARPRAAGEDSASRLQAIACLLHDGVAQELFATSMCVEELLDDAELPEAVRCRLEQVSDRLAESSRTMRSVLRSLFAGCSPLDVQEPVVERVRRCLAEFQSRSDIRVDLEIEGNAADPAGAAAELLVRSVREGLANVAKHARASRASVVIRRADSWWSVEVHDDGVGRPAGVQAALSSREFAFGLASIGGEAARLGGRMCLSDARWAPGLALIVSVPVEPSGSR